MFLEEKSASRRGLIKDKYDDVGTGELKLLQSEYKTVEIVPGWTEGVHLEVARRLELRR